MLYYKSNLGMVYNMQQEAHELHEKILCYFI